ncbi:MAG: hypothetical protein QOG20_3474 [Pseudonocardiales bacterium]|nr:hypothetical protein [Pseudonocardiales bacterium]
MADSDQGDGPTDPGGIPRHPQGSMRFQDENTTPREPTLAEKKAREQVERRRQAAAQQEADEAEHKRRKRKRLLIGGGVTVGVVAVIAIGYAVSQAGDDEVQAQCVGEDGVIVPDSNCVTPASNNTYHSGGGFYPIFIGGGGRQYHYNYGGTGGIGQTVTGGTATVPKDSTRVTTSSGKSLSGGRVSSSSGSSVSDGSSSSVSRGGLGSSSSGSSSGS